MPEVKVAVTRVASPAVVGNQDITTTDLGGLTPKAALFIVGSGISDGVQTAHALYSYGAATGAANEWASSCKSQDAVSTTQTRRIFVNDHLINILDPGTTATKKSAEFVTFIVNGVRINWDVVDLTDAFLVTVIFFAGLDLSAHADVIARTNLMTGSPHDETAPGFQPDMIFFGGNSRQSNSAIANAIASFGVSTRAVNPPPQATQSLRWRHGQTTSDGQTYFDDSKAIAEITGTVDSLLEISDYDAVGFTVNTTIGNASGDLGYLAIAVGGLGFWSGAIDSPTVTGDFKVSGPGFRPQFAGLGLGFNDSDAVLEEDDPVKGMSVFTALAEFSNAWWEQDSVATSNAKSVSDDQAINLPNEDNSTGFEAVFSSFGADGFLLEFSAVDSTVRKWFGFAIEVDVAPADTFAEVSFTQLQTPTLERQGIITFAEFEVPRIPGETTTLFNRIKDFNEDLLLEELDAVGLKPPPVDLQEGTISGLLFAGFDPDENEPERRIWTPSASQKISYGSLAQPGDLRFTYPFTLTSVDITAINTILDAHSSASTTQEQDSEDQDDTDLDDLRTAFDNWFSLTTPEKFDALCIAVRLILRFHRGDLI